jgi:hypothetical protein
MRRVVIPPRLPRFTAHIFNVNGKTIKSISHTDIAELERLIKTCFQQYTNVDRFQIVNSNDEEIMYGTSAPTTKPCLLRTTRYCR